MYCSKQHQLYTAMLQFGRVFRLQRRSTSLSLDANYLLFRIRYRRATIKKGQPDASLSDRRNSGRTKGRNDASGRGEVRVEWSNVQMNNVLRVPVELAGSSCIFGSSQQNEFKIHVVTVLDR